MADKPNPPKHIYIVAAIVVSVLTFFVMRFIETSIRKKPAAPAATSEQAAMPQNSVHPRAIEDIDFDSYSTDLARHTGLAIGQSRGEAVDNVRLYFAPQDGSTVINTTHSKFEREDGAVLLFGASGLPDDSVKAQEIFLILEGPKGAPTLGAYGTRIKCQRGNNTTKWQIELCP